MYSKENVPLMIYTDHTLRITNLDGIKQIKQQQQVRHNCAYKCSQEVLQKHVVKKQLVTAAGGASASWKVTSSGMQMCVCVRASDLNLFLNSVYSVPNMRLYARKVHTPKKCTNLK